MSTSTRDAAATSADPTPGLAAWITALPPRSPRSGRRTVVRILVLTVAVGVALGLLVLFVTGPRLSGAPLDPDDTGHSGARAVAQVLRQQGVDVSVVRSVDDLERTLDTTGPRNTWTVVMADASYLGTGAAERLTRAVEQARRFVLVEPDDVELQDLQLPLTVADRGTTALTAGCTSDVTDPGNRLSAGWTSYAPAPSTVRPRRDPRRPRRSVSGPPSQQARRATEPCGGPVPSSCCLRGAGPPRPSCSGRHGP